MLRDWKGPYHRRLARKLSERGRRMAAARWAKWRAEAASRPEPEPRMERTTGISFGLRDEVAGVECWVPLRSGRDAARRIAVVLREYQPGYPIGG